MIKDHEVKKNILLDRKKDNMNFEVVVVYSWMQIPFIDEFRSYLTVCHFFTFKNIKFKEE